MTTRRKGGLDKTDLDIAHEDTFDALLKKVAHISGPAEVGLGLRLRPGDTLRDGRLHIRRRLGEGGMGVVYEAYDQERRGPVALKTLSRLDAESIYRLKKEFRSLAGVSHPNLCQLHELFSDGGDWFFTMRLLEAMPFEQWVRPGGVLDEARLLSVTADLFHGMEALHGADKLHRDLKPSNVMVVEEGRAVILDFGLVADPETGGAEQMLSEGVITGTPAYMAPEQAAGRAASPASDYYALGVMLFEALSGRLPFEGGIAEILYSKQTLDPPTPSSLGAPLRPQLEALCMRLLSRDAVQRPDATELRRLLEVGPATLRVSGLSRAPVMRARPAAESSRPPPTLLGRDVELARLESAHATMLGGQPVVMIVSGESGMGKSALVHAFLSDVEQQRDTVVLAGRCYERDNVPFKGFDALIDDLSRHWRRLNREEAAAILPRDVFALARVFPVLERVQIVAGAPLEPTQDPQDLRRRAFDGFRELVARLRDRRPLCIFIDDLQWFDADSVLFLRALLVDREPAPVMLVLSHRTEGAANDEQLHSLIELAEANNSLRVEKLSLAPVDALAAAQLSLQTLPPELEHRHDIAESIAREAGGSPFFVAELARHAARLGGAVSGLSLPAVLGASVAALDVSARSLLELSALSGQPLLLDVLLAGAGSNHDALDELRARQLVRSSHATQGKKIECYHDRIREYVSAQLDREARSQRYASLAAALLELDPNASPELLMTCFEGCGEPLQGSHFAAIAAARAEQGMAFDHAAALYRKALDLGAPNASNRRRYQVALAEALSNAGRAKQSAEAFLVASELAHGAPASDLRRRAADELLGAGYAAEGEQLLAAVLREVDVTLPRSQTAALVAFGLSQIRLRLSDYGAKQPRPEPGDPRQRLRLDVMQSATRLGTVDPVQGAWASDQYLLLALASGDDAHLARALSLQGYTATVFTPKAERRIVRLFARAQRHADAHAARTGSHALQGLVATYEGTGIVFGRGIDAATCRALLQHGLESMQGSRDVRHELDIANLYRSMVFASGVPDHARRVAALIEEAFSLGRIWSATLITAVSSFARLVNGDVGGVTLDFERAKAVWLPQRRADMQWIDISLLGGQAMLANYEHDPSRVLAATEEAWPWFSRSPLRRGSVALALMHGFRGVAAVAMARTPGTEGARARAMLKLARQQQKELAKLPPTLYSFLGRALAIGLALAENDRANAVRLLRLYIASPSDASLLGNLDQLGAQRRLGQLLGGTDGAAMLARADDALREQGVADLDATTEMVLPGCSLGTRRSS